MTLNREYKNKMNRFTFCIGLVCIWIFLNIENASGATVEIGSSPNPVGSGARALGMGGAFIAVADDATAASWNPGGLIQLETPEISFVGGYLKRNEAISFESNPEAAGDHSVDEFSPNYLSAAYPFELNNRNMIVSLNYQRLYDFNRYWVFNINGNIPGSSIEENYKQEGSLYALGLAYATMITKNLSAGFTLNYWGDVIHDNEWTQTYYEITTWPPAWGMPQDFSTFVEEYTFKGWNANLGFLWRASEHWTLGGVFKLPFTADIEHKRTLNGIITSDTKDEMDMPMSYGLGVAYRHSDTFTVSADAYRTHWEDFIYRTQTGVETSPISSKPISESDIDPTTWLRLGAEYLYIGKKVIIPIRGGIFYDPAPAEGSADRYMGFTLGSGIAYKWFVWDIAYQFRYGKDVGRSMLQHLGFSQDTKEHTIYSSIIIHFE
ncbi:MAG: hypothetical protein GY699_06400 [Desulfobacteraceae bacterium]|nr:hypothetical protein [Desulfobacteraceae bacterium]